jgi:cell surface protein SprA
VENSQGSPFIPLRQIVKPTGSTTFVAICLSIIFSALTPNAQSTTFVKFSENFVVVQDTVGIIYDDIDRRPARFRDRREIDWRTRDRDVPGALLDTTITREELQERLLAPTDSTARLRHFTYRRKDRPYASASGRTRRHPLFLDNKNRVYNRSVELDSLGTSVIIRETVNGSDVKVPVMMSLDNYIQNRSRTLQREGWERLAYEYEIEYQEERQTDLGDFLTDITTIDIPVPPNPLLNIFGKPGIRLNISGAVDIRAGFRRQKSDQTTLSRIDNTRNEPDFKQDVQINVSGLVGDKLNILADWNTQRTFEYENQLKIRYEGYADEIIQSVEAGNVSLQTPTQFIGSSQALFGIKSHMQFGPMRLTAVASQQKGRSEELTLSGGAQEQIFEIRPYDYSRNHYFVDEEYIEGFEAAMALEPRYNPQLEITDMEVWMTRSGIITDVNERPVTAHIDLPEKSSLGGFYTEAEWGLTSVPSDRDGEIEIGQFILLREGEDYIISTRTGRLTMRKQIAETDAIAIAYRRADGSVFGDFVESVDDDSTRLVLKLIRPRNLRPGYQKAWNLQLRNIYPIGGRNLQREGFELRIEYDVPGQEPTDELGGQQLLQVLGLDQTDESGSPVPDNRFDWRPGVTIDPTRGELIFPSLRPFDHKLAQAELNEYRYPEVYDTTATAARQRTEKDRFRIRGRYSSSVASSYNLGFNVVEGSVAVFMGNQRLQEGTDYSVDYMLGQITIRNEAALQQGADLRITYEQNELFQIASKTLLGLRGEMPLGRNTDINFTVMSMREETLADKVRVGEEPISNTIFGFDGRTRIPMNFVTDAMNKLPFFNTMTESNLQFSGEAAYIRPNRNTKRSTVDMDQGKGVAYIDDFEGSRRSVPIGVNYGNWRFASPPVVTPFLDYREDGRDKPEKMVEHKAKAYWYNALPSDEVTLVSDIWPERQVQRGEERVQVLHVRYNPRQRAEYNYSWDIMETVYNTPYNSWGGMMRAMTGSTNNLVNENLNFIEFWARVEGDISNGKMFINMGQINERIIYEERLRNRRVNGIHQEDGSQGRQPTGVLNEGEDVGLDGIRTEEEREIFADWLQHYQGTLFYEELSEDPSGDNYRPPRSGDYSGVTGVEGNAQTEVGYLPDTEDLNRNGIVDLSNSYFEYEISLDTANAFQENPYIIGGGNNGWYQFRIPIRDYQRRIGNPSFDNVEFFRVWFTGFEDELHVRIAEFAFSGNQWEEEIRDDDTFIISVLNKQENPEYYSPPGVRPPRERLPDGDTIEGNEQSLVLTVNNLNPNDSRQAFRYFPQRSLDVFNYRSLRMFVHGDLSWYVNESGTQHDAEIFIRFGADTANYYEYRQPVWPGWHENNFVHIDFGQLTATKAVRDTATNMSDPIPVQDGPPGATYRVVRDPSLTQIRYMSIGISNPTDERSGRRLRGQVWVNEMRLIDIDDTPGWAYRVSSSFNLADFGTVRFNMSQTDPNFHRLDRNFGTRQTSRNWEVGANFSLQKLLPQSWQRGTELPINYTRSESIINPQYIPQTDILISGAMERQKEQLINAGVDPVEAERMVEEIRVSSQTVRVTDTYSAPTIRVQVPSERWYLRETINNLRFGFNYNNTRDRSPTIEHRQSWSWQARSTYQLSFSRNNYWQPFKNLFDGVPLLDHYKEVRFFYTPANFNTGLNLQRAKTDERQRRQDRDRPTVRNFTANRNMAFSWRFVENAFLNPSFDYRLNIASSLVHLELDELGRQRPISHIAGDIFGGTGMINFGIDNNYNQEVRLDTRPRLPSLWDINRYFEINTGYSAGYRWTRNLAQETLGRSAGVNARFDASMNLNLKDLGNRIFGVQPQQPAGRGVQQQPPRGRSREEQRQPQEIEPEKTEKPDEDEDDDASGFEMLKKALHYLIKVPFLDYDRITISFNQNRNIQNSGLVGGTGLHNFWGKIPFMHEPDPEYGPSRMYQIGLSSSPGAIRAPNGSLMDSFAETNRVTVRTQRQLWQGARIDLNWNYSWSFNRNHSLLTDSIGVPTISSTNFAGDIDRSFMTLPQFPGVSMLGGNLDEVINIFQNKLNDPTDQRTEGEKLSAAFEEGMEAFSLLRGIFGDALPRVNWNFRWEGLERLGIFESWARRVSLDHSYASSYTTRWRGRSDSDGKQTEMQRITMGFNPLLGINVTFKDFMKGNLSANTRYNTTTHYDLNYSSRIIVQSVTQEISFTASYGRRGFAVPLFGLALSNDIDISLTYSLARNERLRYTTEALRTDGIGQTDDGAARTSFEPRVRYVLSQRVTASIFYRHSKVTPNKEGSRTPGMTTNEAGLDINISIR